MKIDENKKKKKKKILYTNWKNETRYRLIKPISIEFKSTEWHKEKQWILNAVDIEKNAIRNFAMRDIKEWKANLD